jgi:hypothetical protein
MPPKPRPIAFRIELLHVTPLVWRRIVVPNQWTLASLHHYLQWVMGWQDCHAHEFRIGEQIIAPDWWIHESAHYGDVGHYRDERRVSVAAVIKEIGPGGEFSYAYDMGDDWEHRLIAEEPPAAWAAADLPLPCCTAGENACPPEDVGGPHGYTEFLRVIADPRDEEHGDMLRWAGGVFDPRGFDLNRINRDWRGVRKRRG